MSTLLLTRTDVSRLLEPLILLDDLRRGFVAAARATIPPQRARSDLPRGASSSPNSAAVLFPGLLDNIPAYSVKVHAKFPGETPAMRGLVQLFDSATGALLAVLDSGYLSALRIAAAAAVAADALAQPEASRVALIGAGTQNAWQLGLLSHVRQL